MLCSHDLFPLKQQRFNFLFLLFALPSFTWIFRRAAWSHLELWFYVCDVKWQSRLSWCVERRTRNKNWAGYLTCLICQPHHKKANELFSWDPSERCNNSIWSMGAGERLPLTPCARWMILMASKHTSGLNMNNRFVSVWQADSPAPSCLSTVVISVPCLSIQQRGNLLPPFVGGRLPVKKLALASGCGARTHWKDAI